MWRHDGIQRKANYVTHCREKLAPIHEQLQHEQQLQKTCFSRWPNNITIPHEVNNKIPHNVIRIGCANMHCMWRHDGMQRTATYVTHCRKNRASICERMHNEQQHTDHDFRMQHNLKTNTNVSKKSSMMEPVVQTWFVYGGMIVCGEQRIMQAPVAKNCINLRTQTQRNTI